MIPLIYIPKELMVRFFRVKFLGFEKCRSCRNGINDGTYPIKQLTTAAAAGSATATATFKCRIDRHIYIQYLLDILTAVFMRRF